MFKLVARRLILAGRTWPFCVCSLPKAARCAHLEPDNGSIRLRLASVVPGLVMSIALGLIGGGCSSPSGSDAAPKPGSGIAEYRQVTGEAHRSVTAVVGALAALPGSSTPPSTRPALARFDNALHELELTSVRTRARAEAIMARGQAYFDEWKEHLAGVTNPAAAQSGMERHARLFGHFGRVRERSGEVREEFRPFMANLRQFRAGLDRAPKPAESELSGQKIDGLIASGRRVLGTLESVSTALDEAETELRTTLKTRNSTEGFR